MEESQSKRDLARWLCFCRVAKEMRWPQHKLAGEKRVCLMGTLHAACAEGQAVVWVQAIEFVQMQRDDELWELLISLAIGSADLTGGQPPASIIKM